MRVIGGVLKSGIEGNKIPVPLYMKTNLGFEPGTCVFFFVPKERKELILSPINPLYWKDLWKINLILHERIGVVSDALELIKNVQAWSCIAETVTTEINNKHEVTIIFNPIKDNKEECPIDKKLLKLRKRLHREFGERLHDDFFNYKYGHIEVSQMEYLPSLWKELEPERRDFNDKENNYNYMGEVIGDGWVAIPDIDDYKNQVTGYFNTTSKIFLFSDTEEKYIKYSFLSDSDSLFWLDIHWSNFEFIQYALKFFSDPNIKINILGSYSLPVRRVEGQIEGIYSVILDLSQYYEKTKNSNGVDQQQILNKLMQDTAEFLSKELDRVKPELVNKIQSGFCFVEKYYDPSKKRKKFHYSEPIRSS